MVEKDPDLEILSDCDYAFYLYAKLNFEIIFLRCEIISLINKWSVEMDAKIKKIQKKTKSLEKDESKLLKADKKRDKACSMGEKMMKKKK